MCVCFCFFSYSINVVVIPWSPVDFAHYMKITWSISLYVWAHSLLLPLVYSGVLNILLSIVAYSHVSCFYLKPKSVFTGLPRCGRTLILSGVKSTHCTSPWVSIHSPFMSWMKTPLGNIVIQSCSKMSPRIALYWGSLAVNLWCSMPYMFVHEVIYLVLKPHVQFKCFGKELQTLNKQTSSDRWSPRLSD